MSKRILDYDPITGITDIFEYDSLTDTTILSRHQDVEPILEANKTLRNDADYSKKGIKNEMWHYATIPNVVQEALLKKGINMDNKDHAKKFFKVLESEFPYLKTTTKVHVPRT